MAPDIELSVILPSYLEEENLRLILPRLKNTLLQTGISHEVIVVDTMTPMDNTETVCGINEVRYVNRKNGNEFGNAVRTGIKEARGKYVLFMDADGSHPPEFIPNLTRHMHENDVVIASRYIKGGYTENSLILVLMSRALNSIYALILNLKCRDVSNSFKIYRSDILKKIDLYCDNFDIVEEVLFKAGRNNKNLKIKEVPFSFKKRMFGKTKRNLIAFIMTYIITLLKLRFGK